MIDVPVLVKDALRDGRRLKNYRILVLNDDGTTDFVIDNNTLVSETVDIDERMCSGDTIKFGLCEGSSIEFQYFNHPSIYGRQINVFVDVWSDYVEQIEEPTWHNIKTLTETDGSFTVVEPGTYKIDYIGPVSFKIEWTRNGVTYEDEIFPMPGADSYPLGDLVAGDTIRAYTEFAYYTFSIDLKGYYAVSSHWYTIPMGFFTVEKCSRQASTGIKKVTAYNKLKSDYLDAKANDLLVDVRPDAGDEISTLYNIKSKLLKDYNIIEVDFKSNDITYSGQGRGSRSLDTNAKLNGDSRTWTIYSNTANVSYIGIFHTPIILTYVMFHNLDGLVLAMQNALDSLLSAINSDLSNASAVISRIKPKLYEQISIELSITGSYTYYTLNDLYEIASHTSDINVEPISNLNEANINNLRIGYVNFPQEIYMTTGSWPNIDNHTLLSYTDAQLRSIFHQIDGQILYTRQENLSPADQIEVNVNTIPDFTLREITSAIYETECQFGKLDRVTDLFAGVELNNSRLFPAEDLYPDDSLYPDGAALSSEKSMYSKLWADEGNIQKWRNLIITYKGLDENNQEKDFTLQRQVNADGTQDYNMSDNWIFKNLVWTAEDVGDYADAMVAKMRDVTWFPFEMWCAGLPYLETGDELEISIGQTTYTSYVLQRQLKGIQNLQDTYINGTLDIF